MKRLQTLVLSQYELLNAISEYVFEKTGMVVSNVQINPSPVPGGEFHVLVYGVAEDITEPPKVTFDEEMKGKNT